jgi:uncharacterized damage-inducible protein DinB
MTNSLLNDAFAHHIWATELLIDACTPLTPDQLESEAPGTYGAIIDTLRHLVESDSWYLSFFSDRSALTEDDAAKLGPLELRAEFSSRATSWMELLAGEVDPDRDIIERDDEWEVRSPVGVRLAQVVHHGTDHRSQVCTALTSLGLEPPEIDLWAYARATGRERAVRLAAAEHH